MTKGTETKEQSRYATCAVWIEKAQDATHRAELAASWDLEPSDDWLDEEEGE